MCICIKLARCKQTDSRWRNQTIYQYLQWHKHKHVVRRCCCYESRGVQRLEAKGQGAGWWHPRFWKYVDSLSAPEWKGCIFKFFQLETRFQKRGFSGTTFPGSMWMVSQNDAKHAFLQKSVMCGRFSSTRNAPERDPERDPEIDPERAERSTQNTLERDPERAFRVDENRPTQRLKCTFLKTGLRVAKSNNAALLVLVWTANPHTLWNDDVIAPPLDLLPPTSEPRDVSWQQQQWRTTCLCSCHRRYWLLLLLWDVVVSEMHAPSLLLRFWWISSATYRPGIWTTAFLVVFWGSV